jgi:hypothetical protein
MGFVFCFVGFERRVRAICESAKRTHLGWKMRVVVIWFLVCLPTLVLARRFAAEAIFGRLRDTKVDASWIHLETPLNPSVSCTHRWRALLWGGCQPGCQPAADAAYKGRQAGCQSAAGATLPHVRAIPLM